MFEKYERLLILIHKLLITYSKMFPTLKSPITTIGQSIGVFSKIVFKIEIK